MPVIPLEPEPTADAVARAAAFEAFAAALPRLHELGAPRVTHDERSAGWFRRLGQRAIFRIIRPYWFQQRQFQDALLDAVRGSFERLAAPDSVPPVTPPPEAEPATPGPDAPRDQDGAPAVGHR
jgi:hypothetical protein